MGLPPVRNCPLLLSMSSRAHFSFALPRSKGRDTLINSLELSSFPAIELIESSLGACSAFEVELTRIRRSPCSSKSQVETESAPSVSDINRDVIVASSISSRQVQRPRVKLA